MNDLNRILIIREVDGVRVGFVAYDTPDDAPADVREGLTCRRLTFIHGQCPSCDAGFTLPTRQQRRAAERHDASAGIRVYHSDGCPAGEQTISLAIERWHANDR